MKSRPHVVAMVVALGCGLLMLWNLFMLFATWWEHDTVTYIQLLKQPWFWVYTAQIVLAAAMAIACTHIYERTRRNNNGTDNRRHYNPSTAPDRCACGRWIPKGSVYCLNCIPY